MCPKVFSIYSLIISKFTFFYNVLMTALFHYYIAFVFFGCPKGLHSFVSDVCLISSAAFSECVLQWDALETDYHLW